ncbi:MAG TPA: methylenetetrahydrofolate--tRNA-(uracil(54)-C(5))-methyltransferase (FADH(2)-oxidizing) TrmFO [Proteobacteria bacterium]|nr:methylenetetrahydrofolate--tRNA-(uracil(54)-C(5))-methyltransferase (FADH(2)-oxidizing) TrmFO [Pseudomonadota bacterium]
MKHHPLISIIGGGLSGCEAAWQLASRNLPVTLYEMKPERYSPAHKNPDLAELVCSNSLRAERTSNAAGLLKEEMRRIGSLIMNVAEKTRVPAGNALAVDRDAFSRAVTSEIESHPLIEIVRKEVTQLPEKGIIIIAGGPLSSAALIEALTPYVGEKLFFYDATAPIIAAESIDYELAFFANRYADEEEDGDYLNCPLNQEQYEQLIATIAEGDQVVCRDFEDLKVFEGCMPIEAMVARGPLTLAFGPLKPKGLKDPHTGREAYAVVQLRRENQAATMYNLVGFQTRLTFPWQEKVIRLIPALQKAEILRFGTMHRNTFIDAPRIINQFFQHRQEERLFFAGQISGVEGYPESVASGLIVGLEVAALLNDLGLFRFPPTTALGALSRHISNDQSPDFQPMNVNFGLFPPLEGKKLRKRERLQAYAERALQDLDITFQEYPELLAKASPST